MKKFLNIILKIVFCILGASFIGAIIITFSQGNIEAGIIGIVISAPIFYVLYVLFKPQAKEQTTLKNIDIDCKIPNQEFKERYSPENISYETSNTFFNYDFDHRYKPEVFKDEPYYELYSIFENENLDDNDQRDLIDRIITLYAQYYSVPVYFQDVERIKEIIETKIEPTRRKEISIKFLKILMVRNNVLIDYEINKEEINLYKLKTKKGRLNRIARLKDNFYLYKEYLSGSNLDYLDEKIDYLKSRFRLDEDEIIDEQ